MFADFAMLKCGLRKLRNPPEKKHWLLPLELVGSCPGGRFIKAELISKRRLLLIALYAFIVAVALSFALRPDRLAAPIGKHTSQVVKVPAFVRSLRPNFPYSVIPGGAYSQSELRFASQNDPLVREHYRGFDIHSTRLARPSAGGDQYEDNGTNR